MQLKGKIINITITEKKVLSLNIRIEKDTGATSATDEIQKLKDVSLKYILSDIEAPNESVYFTGVIKSVNLAKGVRVILHTPAIPAVVLKAMDLQGKLANLRFTSDEEHELIELLKAAARMENSDPEEVLCRLTTFDKDGRTIQGKRSIYDISESQRKVVLSKLHKSLSAPRLPSSQA